MALPPAEPIANKEPKKIEQVIVEVVPEIKPVPTIKPTETTTQDVGYNPILNSCVKYVRSKIPLPSMRTPADVKPNIPACTNCAVLFEYPNGDHIALSEYLFPGGVYISETNWKTGKYTERFIHWDDPAFLGFYKFIPLTKK